LTTTATVINGTVPGPTYGFGLVNASNAVPSVDVVVARGDRGDYSSIQTAVNNANQNDRIEIKPGIYTESVDINKNISIAAPSGATIAPSSGSVSAVTIEGGAEPSLVNLSIEGSNRIGLDARSTTGDWTAIGLNITGFDFGITTLRSEGDWLVKDTTIENIGSRGISTDQSEGNWTINSSTIRTVSGIGIDAYQIKAGVIKNTIITNITNTSQNNEGDGINLCETSGNWVIENVSVSDVDNVGINAGEGNATHTAIIQNTTVEGTAEEGIDFYVTQSNVRIIGTTVRNTGEGKYNNGIEFGASTGDWTVADTTLTNISGEGISAYKQPKSSQATIRNVTVTDTQNHGVNFYNSSGDWKITNSYISNNSWSGVEASDSAGDWKIINTKIQNADDFLIGARRANGTWQIYESKLVAAEIAVNATGAVMGNASYNYWNASDGPSGDFSGSGSAALGNITVSQYYTDAKLTKVDTLPNISIPQKLRGEVASDQYRAVLTGESELSASNLADAINSWSTNGQVNDVEIGAFELSELINYWADE
jgi:hypothetical protein